MSDMAINSVLAQIRSISAQVHGLAPGAISPDLGIDQAGKAGKASPGSFASLMQQGLEQVNQTQVRSDNMTAAFERGTPGVELPDVMIELQKANVSFRALTEVRNRFVTAYQEIMNIPI